VLTSSEHGDHDASSSSSSSSDSSISTTGSINTLKPKTYKSDGQDANDAIHVPWSEYFQQELHLVHHTSSQRALYHAYLTPPANLSKGPLFICHHGAGASGMSFAPLSKKLQTMMPEAGILSLEAREHGSIVISSSTLESPSNSSISRNDLAVEREVLDFSIDTLTNDAQTMISLVAADQNWKSLPPCILIGHSLGGMICTRLASTGVLGQPLVGVMVLDVVEGSAVEAIQFMKTHLAARPQRFSSVEEAIEWHVRNRVIRDASSAAISVPGLLKVVVKEDGNVEGFTWKTNLIRTQPWWEGWFSGMSKAFLQSKCTKSLILAGTDRLDKELMVGQMQGLYHIYLFKQNINNQLGKFQLTVIPGAGHFLHEDVPERMARLAIDFFKRNDRSALVLPPKVSDLIAQGKKV